jgi:hypothetical protein
MKSILSLVGLLAAAVLTASAQDIKPLPPKTIREAVAIPATAPVTGTPDLYANTPPANPFFCPPKTCLYYSGDSDTSSPNYNGLFDIDNPGIGISDAEVWVGVKPRKNATVTGTSGNYFTVTTSIGTNPTPFAVQTGITAGRAGRVVCKTTGNAIIETNGLCGNIELDCENYRIRKLAQSCKLKKGKVYFVTMQPQYNDNSTIGYLADDDGAHANKRGWPEITDKSYFNSSSFGIAYEPTWGSSGACGGIGCSGFSISLTGKEE